MTYSYVRHKSVKLIFMRVFGSNVKILDRSQRFRLLSQLRINYRIARVRSNGNSIKLSAYHQDARSGSKGWSDW